MDIIVVGGMHERKRKQRKIVLNNIFTNAISVPFALSTFRMSDSHQKKYTQGSDDVGMAPTLEAQVKTNDIRNKIYYIITQ